MFFVFVFWNHFKFEKDSFRRTKSHPAVGSLGEAIGRQKSAAVEHTAGVTTGRERCEGNASV